VLLDVFLLIDVDASSTAPMCLENKASLLTVSGSKPSKPYALESKGCLKKHI
jgi:hypothetical protein